MRTEFGFIRNIKEKYGLKLIGDDCAVLPKDSKTSLVITTDMLVEDVDFRRDWTSPEFLGHKALAVSLSDIAAMGAIPQWALLSLAVPSEIWSGEFLDRLFAGWHRLADENKVELAGGDISKTADKLVIDSIVVGEVETRRAVFRNGARPGDSIFVTGQLGGASGALQLLESGLRYSKVNAKRKHLFERQLKPNPRVSEGQFLAAGKLATSMIDISDGLSSDLAHLCRASNVGAVISELPIDQNLSDNFSEEDAIHMALNGGEDFELLFTVEPRKISKLKGLDATRIGVITANPNKIRFSYRGRERSLRPKGYRHF